MWVVMEFLFSPEKPKNQAWEHTENIRNSSDCANWQIKFISGKVVLM